MYVNCIKTIFKINIPLMLRCKRLYNKGKYHNISIRVAITLIFKYKHLKR